MSGNVHKYTERQGTVYWRFFLVLVYAGIIFTFSSIPGQSLPSIRISDKLLHAVEFGGLAFLLCRACRAFAPARSPRFIAVISIGVTLCYGVIDEAHQLLVAQRVADLADLVADGLGAFLAGWGWRWAGKRWLWIA